MHPPRCRGRPLPSRPGPLPPRRDSRWPEARAPSSSLSVVSPGGAGRHPPERGSPSGRMRTHLPCRLTRHILNGSIEEVKSDITDCRRGVCTLVNFRSWAAMGCPAARAGKACPSAAMRIHGSASRCLPGPFAAGGAGLRLIGWRLPGPSISLSARLQIAERETPRSGSGALVSRWRSSSALMA